MIILITGPTHVGKTALAQRLLEKHNIPYYSQDHLKMGLIRSGYLSIKKDATDESLTELIWAMTREVIKTAIENDQNIIVEGCYIPFDWKKDFDDQYINEIKYICLCFSDKYIDSNYEDILKYESIIEKRINTGYCSKELIKKENQRFYNGCIENGLSFVLIEDEYQKAIDNIEI